MSDTIDMAGRTFIRWTVLRRADKALSSRINRCIYWVCRCECGVIKEVNGYSLRCGDNQSCGCLAREQASTRMRSPKRPNKPPTHGATVGGPSREYISWASAKARCFNIKQARYSDYGGRGITMCDRWKNSFPAFLNDMGKKPKGLTLERKNVNGDYEPTNCIWASWLVQARNKRNSKHASI